MKATLIVIENDAEHARAKALVDRLMASSAARTRIVTLPFGRAGSGKSPIWIPSLPRFSRTTAFIASVSREEGEHTASFRKSTKPSREGNAMRMILLHSDAATAPIYINPQLVRIVVPGRQSGARVYFDDVHSVEVQETAETVTHEIESVC